MIVLIVDFDWNKIQLKFVYMLLISILSWTCK